MAGPGSGRVVFPAACLIAVATVVGAYSNSLQNAFHFDDSHVVVSNLYIRSLSHIPRFFRDATTYSSLPANQAYRPLVTTTLALDYRLGGGLQVWQFHASQLTMLVFLGVAVFFMFAALMNMSAPHWWNRWAALLAATLYTAHTTNTETLNLMHVRSELLSTLGAVGSFLVYFYLPRTRRTFLYLLPMVAGALAKSPAVIFAPLFLVYLWLFEERLSLPELFTARAWPRTRAAIWRSLPAFAFGAGAFLFTESMNARTLVMGGGSRIEYLRTQPFMWLNYGRMFFVPTGLSVDTDWKLIASWTDTRVVAGVFFIAILLRLLWRASKEPSQRPVAFGLAWFALALLPASSIFPLAEVTNDHRAFFAYIGLALAVIWGLALLVERWSAMAPGLGSAISVGAVALVLVAIGGNAAGTYERNKVFLTEESMWRDVVEKSPANGRGLMNFGLAQMARGRYAEAKELFDRAAVYNPNYATLEINLGIVTDRLGDPAAAEAHFARALQLQPGYPAAHVFFARWLTERGRTAEAVQHLEQAIALAPGDMDARHDLLAAYAKAGRAPDVKALAAATLVMAPGDQIATGFLNRPLEAVVSQSAPPDPGTPEGLMETSLRLYKAGNFQGSIEAARKALALKPDYAEAHNNIAAGLASLGEWDEAIAEARQALLIRPDFPLARGNLRWAETERAKAQRVVK